MAKDNICRYANKRETYNHFNNIYLYTYLVYNTEMCYSE